MKAKDLKWPYTWEKRQPFFGDQIFFIPDHYPAHDKSVFPSLQTIFPQKAPLHLEYCSGNGMWLIEKAQANPDVNWIGVEKQFDRASKIWARMKNAKLQNLLVVCGEAQVFTQHYLPSASVQQIFINFPDPWPKKRHHKHRLINRAFLEQIERVLLEQGKFTFVTDDEPYLEWALRHLKESVALDALHPAPLRELPGYGSSFFETLWRGLGKAIYYLEYQKVFSQT